MNQPSKFLTFSTALVLLSTFGLTGCNRQATPKTKNSITTEKIKPSSTPKKKSTAQNTTPASKTQKQLSQAAAAHNQRNRKQAQQQQPKSSQQKSSSGSQATNKTQPALTKKSNAVVNHIQH